jgi:hypothetical protein
VGLISRWFTMVVITSVGGGSRDLFLYFIVKCEGV